MATLWTAVAAAGGAVAGAAISALVTYRITSRQVSSAEAVAAQERGHQRDLATEALHQRRLEEAYVAVTEWVLATDDTLDVILRGQEPKEGEDVPLGVRTVASLHGSADVGKLV